MIAKYLLSIILLLSIGCNSQSSIVPIIKDPPHFSFVDISNNVLQIEKMKEYDKIIKTSPIPVFIMDQNSLPPELVKSSNIDMTFTKLYGLYVFNNKIPSYPKNFIFINNKNSPEVIVITFFHELQHYKCRKYNCYCQQLFEALPKDEKMTASILREKRALENELRESLKLEDAALLVSSISIITDYVLISKIITYKAASICVSDGVPWKESINFILGPEKEKIKKVR